MNRQLKRRIGYILLFLFIIFMFTFLFIAYYFKGYELTLNVSKDASVYENQPNSNYGNDNYLRVGNYYASSVQTFYYFNISSLPNNWRKANIIVNFDSGSGVVDVGANLTYERWDEMTITWNNKPNESVYRGHILCDGFDFRIPLTSDQIMNDGVSVCLYGLGGEGDGYIQGYSKEGASSSDDIAWIELSYKGMNPAILDEITLIIIIICIVFGSIGLILLIFFIKLNKISKKSKKPIKKNLFGVDWLNANLDYVKSPIKSTLEKEINEYITLKLVNGRTFIFVNGKRFIQCIRLILNIPTEDAHLYDEVESIDEAAKLHNKYVFQNRIVRGRMAAPVPNQRHNITPEQEFWGHCSNIQAWVEHDYDTRILMSNISFPLLRELTKVGDPKAKRVYKEEIALRLESGFPSVVQYLLTQGYIQVFSPSEFKTILESTSLIKNISSEPKILFQFLRSSFLKFPTVLKDIILQILKLPDGKNILCSSIQIEPKMFPFRPYVRYSNPQFLSALKSTLEDLKNQVDEKIAKDILNIILVINNKLEGKDDYISNLLREREKAMKNIPINKIDLDQLNDKQKFFIKELEKLRKEIQGFHSRCLYCGKIIPKGQDICDWCGHKKDDDEGGFFPYPFIFKPPGGGGGAMKGSIAVSVKVKS
ncbi:MAG: DNRLRE domain-containing protein [Candidatus Hermodarchaeota archaeon]